MESKTKEKLIFLAICFLAVFLMYGRTLWGDFVFDDRGILDHRAMLADLNQLHRTLISPYWTEETGLYRPITLATYSLNYFFFGSGAWGFHLVNLIFYALSGFLLFLVIDRVFGKKILAWTAAVLFLVLPIHTEAVANIVGRAEILALFFSLLFFWELTRHQINRWRPGLWFLLALGSKETAIAALPLALLIIYFYGRVKTDEAGPGEAAEDSLVKISWLERKIGGLKFLPADSFFKKSIFWKYFYPSLSILAGGAIYFSVRLLILGRQYFSAVETSLVENPLKFASGLDRLATAFKVLAIYLQKSFWPFGLCSDYSYNQIPVLHNFFNLAAIAGLAAFLFFIAGFFAFWRRAPVLSLASAWFLFSFLPVANLIFPTGTIAGERLMYYPSLGLVLFLAWGLVALFEILRRQLAAQNDKKRIWENFVFFALCPSLILFYGWHSYERSLDWLTEKRLFVSAVRCAPSSVLSRSNLGAVYYLEGNLAEAKKELLRAQEIYDSYPKGVNNLGLIYWKEGDKAKARQYFLRTLSFRFPYYGAYENLALMALEERNIKEAKDWLLKFYSGNEEAADLYIRIFFESQKKN